MFSRYSVKKPYTVLVGVILVIILGYISFTSMTTDLLPSMNLPYLVVYTTYVGASPEEVESEITKPMEASMATVSGVKNISSVSQENVSQIIMEFHDGANMDTVMIEVNSKINMLTPTWNDSVGAPVVMKLNPDMLPVMVASVDKEGLDIIELSALVEETLAPALEAVDGVASVNTSGVIAQSVEVSIEQSKIDELNSLILREVDEELADVEKQLDEGERKLLEAKRKMDREGKKGIGQIDDGLDQLAQAREQLQQAIEQLTAQRAELTEQLQQAVAAEQQISQTLQNLPDALTAEQAAALAGMEQQLDGLRAQIDAKQRELAGIQASLDALDQPTSAPEETQTSAPEETQTPAPEETQTPAPEETQTPAPEETQTPAPEETQTPAPEETQTPAPEETQTPAPEETQTPAPEETQTPAPEETQTPAPEETQTPAPAQTEASGTESSQQGSDDVLVEAPEGSLSEIQLLDKSLFAVAKASGDKTREELQAEKERLEKEIAALEAQAAQISESDAYRQLSQLQSAIENRAQLEAQLSQLRESIPQLEAGIAQIDAMLEKLNQGIIPGGLVEGIDEDTNLDEAEQQLRDARKKAKKALSEGADKIEEAQRELGEKRKEFEEAREEAFKEAKLDGVITLEMIGGLLVAQNFEMPAGYISEGEQDYLVRVGNEFEDLASMRDMLLFELELDSLPEVWLCDVATVTLIDNAGSTYARVNGNDGVALTFQKQSTFSTSEVASAIHAEFEKLMAEDPGLRITPLLDQGIYIDIIVNSVLENLISGGLLAVLVLLLFLGDFRPTLVIALSIPTSVVTAFVVMYFTDISLNVMSLAGLALGVGMLVDNSIVVIENIYRLHGDGMPILKACVKGAQQVAGAIFSSTLTTICVFLPVVFIDGIARDLFVDMGLTIAYSLLASLVVALTLVPVMSAALLRRNKSRKHRILGLLQRMYVAMLRGCLRVKPLVLIVAIALLAFSASQVMDMGMSFMPEVNSDQMSAALTVPVDYTFAQTTQLADQVMERMLSVEGVETVGAFDSGSGVSTFGSGGGDVSFYMTLDSEREETNVQIAERITQAVAPLGCELSIQTSNMDISMLYGTGMQVDVKGEDIDTLRTIASDVADLMRQVEGTTEISDGQEETVPEITLVVDKEAAIREGLTVAQIYQRVATTIAEGQEVTTLRMDDRDYAVLVLDGDNQNLTREDLSEITIEVERTDETVQVRLGDVCEIREGESLQSINRDNQQHVVTASCDVDSQHNIGLVGRELQSLLDGYALPDGYTVSISGESDTINSTIVDLLYMILLAVAMIYLIMVAQFQSLVSPIIVLFTVPLAFTGGLLALIFCGMDISMVSMLGFLVLSGVIVNNGIVFVDSVNQMRLEGMEKHAALIETGRVRLRPILMTALTTILGMSTMALGTGMGAEMMQPMAVVTIGGLSYATLMTLFVVPVLYDMFTGKHMKARDVGDAE